jgi:LacI family transcriptional regulator
MTLDVVAKRARVSTATVSRVLNNVSVVKEATRKRVLQAVEELNYHPNLHARSLAGGKTRTLGMIVSNICNPFFVDIFVGMEAAARERGYEVVVEQTDYQPSQLAASVHSMIGRRVDGLAAIVSEMDEAVMREIADGGLRAVFYDVGVPGPNVANIRVRYEIGMQRMVEYLYSLGHRRMALLGHHSSLAPLAVRQRSFIDAVDRHQGAIEFATVVNTDTPAGAMQAVHELLASGFDPSAIVCVNDCMAIGAMRAVRSYGLRVPQDISITGFDNIEFSEFTNPALTTVDIPRRRIGEMAVEMLLDEERSSMGQEFIIEPELVLRDSTGPCKTLAASAS